MLRLEFGFANKRIIGTAQALSHIRLINYQILYYRAMIRTVLNLWRLGGYAPQPDGAIKTARNEPGAIGTEG
jgi:hypothetical protein